MGEELHPEPLTRRRLAAGGFQFHATAFLITNAMAILVYVVTSLLGKGPDFFFPVIPLAVWTPFLALHAVSVFRRDPDEDDVPIELPPFLR